VSTTSNNVQQTGSRSVLLLVEQRHKQISISRLVSCSARGVEAKQHSLERPTGKSLTALSRVTLVDTPHSAFSSST
jgi:hypothetical protein